VCTPRAPDICKQQIERRRSARDATNFKPRLAISWLLLLTSFLFLVFSFQSSFMSPAALREREKPTANCTLVILMSSDSRLVVKKNKQHI
jgi:hypothetical protein